MFCPKCGTENPETGKFCRSCGTNLSNVPAALNQNLPEQPIYYDRNGLKNLKRDRKMLLSNDPDELWSHGINKLIGGIGFLIISVVLLLTNVAGGQAWWWAMLFPAFSMIAAGVSSMSKSKRLEKKRSVTLTDSNQNQLPNSQPNVSLPAFQTEYVKPQQSIYDTGEFIEAPTSVTDATTRHLEINKEGETITLPKLK
jgi:zinc-ribbon domain